MEDQSKSRSSSVASIETVVSFNTQQQWIKHIAPSFADQRWSSATFATSDENFPREGKGKEPESVPVSTKGLDDDALSEKEGKKSVSESSGPSKRPPPSYGGPPPGMGGHPGRSRGPQDPNIVNWDSLTDPDNPLNFGKYHKMWITFQLAMLAFSASLGSSIIASADADIMQYMGVGREVIVLGISLYIAGFGFGPIIWAPISELYGRRWSMLPPTFCMGCFAIGSAVSRNPQTYFITRFLAGLFGSAPVANVSAALGDIYSPQQRGMAITFYSIAVVGGPTLGPTIGATLVVSPGFGWRWTEYIAAIWTFAVLIVTCSCLPETYASVLLKRKAIRARKVTGNLDLYHPHERINPTFKEIFTKHFSRPLKMLFTEPIVTAISVYAAFVYSILYLTIVAFPIVFRGIRDWGAIVSTLPFLGLFVGVVVATGINIANQPRYARLVKDAKGQPVPEGRLAPMAYGAVLFAAGLWWFGWTAGENIHWISPVLASVFIGAGFIVIFQQCMNFLVDTYLMFAASSIAASTILRSIMACGFPLAATPMFSTLGVGPAISILAGIATLGIPIPFILMKYAKDLRGMSKFAPKFGPGGRPGGPPGAMGEPPREGNPMMGGPSTGKLMMGVPNEKKGEASVGFQEALKPPPISVPPDENKHVEPMDLLEAAGKTSGSRLRENQKGGPPIAAEEALRNPSNSSLAPSMRPPIASSRSSQGGPPIQAQETFRTPPISGPPSRGRSPVRKNPIRRIPISFPQTSPPDKPLMGPALQSPLRAHPISSIAPSTEPMMASPRTSQGGPPPNPSQRLLSGRTSLISPRTSLGSLPTILSEQSLSQRACIGSSTNAEGGPSTRPPMLSSKSSRGVIPPPVPEILRSKSLEA